MSNQLRSPTENLNEGDMQGKTTMSIQDALATPEAFQAVWGKDAHKLSRILSETSLPEYSPPTPKPFHTLFLARMILGFKWNEAWVDWAVEEIEKLLPSTPKPKNMIIRRGLHTRVQGISCASKTYQYSVLERREFAHWEGATHLTWYNCWVSTFLILPRIEEHAEHQIFSLLSMLVVGGTREGYKYAFKEAKKMVNKVFPAARGNNTRAMDQIGTYSSSSMEECYDNFLDRLPDCSMTIDENGMLPHSFLSRSVGLEPVIFGYSSSEVFTEAQASLSLRSSDSWDWKYSFYGSLMLLSHEPALWGLDSEAIKRFMLSSPQYAGREYMKHHPNLRDSYINQKESIISAGEFHCCDKIIAAQQEPSIHIDIQTRK